MKKKILPVLAAFCTVFSLASCGKENAGEDRGVPEDNETVSYTDDETVSETESGEEEQTVSYDFTGIDSEKAIKILTSDKYHIKFRYDYTGQPMYQDIYYDSNNILVETVFMGTDYSMLLKDGVQYTLIGDIYYKMPEESVSELSSGDMFEDYGYTESGETELDGKKYRYDEFYQGITDSYTKFLVDDSNELYAIMSSDKVMYIEEYDNSFKSEEKICIGEGMNEVSEDEFNKVFLEMVTSNTDALQSDEG